MKIDLNCDMGEGCGNDAALMSLISSANIACGGHAGDRDTMKQTIELALEYGVAIGAHPGYPDRSGFGREAVEISPEQISDIVSAQVSELASIAATYGAKLDHVKPHGTLYNRSAADRSIAEAIAKAVADLDSSLAIYGLAGSASLTAASEIGLKTAAEAFADRTYQSDGCLTPRSHSNALITDAEAASEQVLGLVKYGRVRSIDGIMLNVKPDTICIHGDASSAVEFAVRIRAVLINSGIAINAVNG